VKKGKARRKRGWKSQKDEKRNEERKGRYKEIRKEEKRG
jgi:hypothetical protein